jgi:2-furoyl-CoA dehydrogenase large subunit
LPRPNIGFRSPTHYPRNSATPIECFVVIAEYSPGEEAYEVVANFQGPFAMHPVMAMALGVPGNRLRLRTPANFGRQFRRQAPGFLI